MYLGILSLPTRVEKAGRNLGSESNVIAQLKSVVRPPRMWLKRKIYLWKFNRLFEAYREAIPGRIEVRPEIAPKESNEVLWKKLKESAPSANFVEVDLGSAQIQKGYQKYLSEFSGIYDGFGHIQEKALEHFLTLELFNFERVERYCDIASAKSPIGKAIAQRHPRAELWKQDLLYKTSIKDRIIGGFAQNLNDVASGFFDALALHCSFEHFYGSADGDFMLEVNRILSAKGACLVLPLYLDARHSVYFDPTVTGLDELRAFDSEALLLAVPHYHQSHGRFYDPQSVAKRVITRIPHALKCTFIRFTNQDKIASSVYLNFGLCLHRENSIFMDKK